MTTYDRASAVAFALDQVGKKYDSPGDSVHTFDCSGLTQAATAAGGLVDKDGQPILPHNSGAQAQWFADNGLLAPATRHNLQMLRPGDVVFYYGTPTNPASIHHCALYVKTGVVRRTVVAAVDWQYGICRQRMRRWRINPSAIGHVPDDLAARRTFAQGEGR